MNADHAIERILQTIDRESTKIASSFAFNPANNIDSRLATLELTRALNSSWWRASLSHDEKDYLDCKTMARGFNVAMAMFMPDHIDKEGVPDAPSAPKSEKWADSVLLQLGTLRLARRVVDLNHAGLIEFIDGAPNRLRFRTIGHSGIAEDDDVHAYRWVSRLAETHDEMEYSDLQKRWHGIQTLLRKHVRVFATHYIGYDAAPELDEYFHRLAILHARQSHGHEAFHCYAEFGGLPFGAFGAAATALVGWSLKHMAFATELAIMCPHLNIRNLLVPWSPIEWKAKSLAAQLELDDDAAIRVLQLFTGTREISRGYANIHDAPIPIFVPAARNLFHFSVASAQLCPYDLLLRRLREQYPSDYFRAVDEREARFREELRRVLPVRRVYFADKPIVLQRDGKAVTDIDALALVKSTGTLGLFQLKWQDPYGGDLRERRNRMTNLVSSANGWLQAVVEWVEERGTKAVVDLANFNEEIPEVRRIIYFVVGRYHCNFSQSQPDERALWCNWAQLLQAVDSVGTAHDPLVAVKEWIRQQYRSPVTPEQRTVATLRLSDFTIVTECAIRPRSEMTFTGNLVRGNRLQ